jgi:hypothetical protein
MRYKPWAPHKRQITARACLRYESWWFGLLVACYIRRKLVGHREPAATRLLIRPRDAFCTKLVILETLSESAMLVLKVAVGNISGAGADLPVP